MLAFKHNAEGFGALRTLASDAETSGGSISLHAAIGGIQGSSFLESEEVHPGMLVRVREDRRRPELEGMVGIVRKSYGAPEYLAVDVELEDGHLELFWFYQLDAPNTDALTHSVAFYDGG
jgi:hypothetical protein